jgi:hypothetical protein
VEALTGPGWLGRLLADLALRLAPCDFEVRYRPGVGATVRGRVPKAQHGEIDAFFRRDLKPSAPVRLRGSRGRGGSLRLRFAGLPEPSDRQRTRNFLAYLLR